MSPQPAPAAPALPGARPPHAVLRLAVWLLGLGLALVVILRTPMVADLSAFLPASTDASQRVLIEQIRSGAPARTLMMAIEGGDAAARAEASRRLAATLRASELFDQVSNGEQSAWTEAGSWVFERRYQLSPAVTPERFTADGLRDAIDETLSLLGTPAGNALKPLLDRDPSGETQRIAEGLLPVRSPRSDHGVWVARSGERALLLASTRAEGSDLDGQQRAIARVRQAFDEQVRAVSPAGMAASAASAGAASADASAAAPDGASGRPLASALPPLRLVLSGSPVFGVESRAQIETEIGWLATAGTLLMSALLLLAFASPVALVVALLPVGSGVMAGIAAVGLGFGSVHGMTLGFGATLIGEAVDYSIYYLIQAGPVKDGGYDEGGWRAWLRHSWPTVRLGLLTSICGFAALVFSGFPGLAQLGVFSIAGLLAAAATTRFILPLLMPTGSRGVGLRRQLGRAAAWATLRLPASARLWLLLGALAALVVWRDPTLWAAELSSLSPVSAQALATDARLRADLGADDGGAVVVVQGASAELTLQRAEAAAARLDGLVSAGTLAGYDTLTRLLPSVQTQQARLAALPERPALQAALKEATTGGPLRAERLAPFLDEVDKARQRQPDTPESAARGPLAPLVKALLMQRPDGSASALLPVTAAGPTLDAAALRQALQGLPGTQVIEIGSELHRMYARYLGEAKAQSLLGALAVVLLVALTLRSPRRVLAVCQPLLLAVLLMLGALAALDVQIGILHLIGLLLVVAVGSNYALFFDMVSHDRASASAASLGSAEAIAAHEHTLASLLLANLTTVLSFGLIATSKIPALSAIGQVVAPGALLALVLSAAFAPRHRQ